MTRPGYNHVLFAADFGPHCIETGARALELATRYQARLSLIHVVDYVPADLPTDMLALPQLEIEDQLVQTASGRLNELARNLGAEGCTLWVEIGSTRHEILRIAEEEGVDLIVLGSQGRSGLALLLGSTANGVLHNAPCDVLAVRVKD
jgi:universal stress protein A